jgi:dienelactone hydrolase
MLATAAAAMAVAGCGAGSAVRAPDVADDWVPPPGVSLDSGRLYQDHRHLFDYDPAPPLDVEHGATGVVDGVTTVELTYASPYAGRVPATIFVPEGSGPFAGIVMMHGMPSDRAAMIPDATRYAEAGAVVITIDAPFARPENAGRHTVGFTDKDRDEQIQLIVDLRRAVDLLAGRPDVDPGRLAYLGVSYGAAMGGLLAGVEDRLQAYVLRVGDGGLVTHFTGSEDQGLGLYVLPEDVRQRWLEAMWPIEPIHYVAHADPAALLFLNGTEDELVPPADALRFQEAGSEPKTVRWYEAGHGLPREAIDDEIAWLAELIGIEG